MNRVGEKLNKNVMATATTEPSLDIDLKGLHLTEQQQTELKSKILQSITKDINSVKHSGGGPGFDLSGTFHLKIQN